MSQNSNEHSRKIFSAPIRSLTADELKAVSGGVSPASNKPSQIPIDSTGFFS